MLECERHQRRSTLRATVPRSSRVCANSTALGYASTRAVRQRVDSKFRLNLKGAMGDYYEFEL